MKQKTILSILSGVLFSLAWTQWGLGWVLLFAFLPLLYVEDYFSTHKDKYHSRHVLFYAYLSFLTWNIISTWWVSNSTLFGGIAAVTLNSLFYAVVFWLFHIVKRKMGKHTGYSALIIFWVAFERLYLGGEISWVWLILGNGFANNTDLIQWYEYTGHLGGSFWVLLVNIMLFNFIQHLRQYKTMYGQYIFTLLFLIVLLTPLIYSRIILSSYQEDKEPVSVSIIQPNIDPYKDKFRGMTQTEQLDKMLHLYQSKGNPNADFVLLPETAIDDGVWENNFYDAFSTNRIHLLSSQHPKLNTIYGATTRILYLDGSKTFSARAYPESNLYYDVFNTAIQVNAQDSLQKYHKSKLVIGVEKTPYPAFFSMFKDLAVELGGTTGNLGIQKERSVFTNSKNKAVVAPIICYESIYGDFVTGYVRNGANMLVILTNDAWWGNTPGYRQHLSFAKLRAIETRRSIARCANTGISAIINQKGEIEQQTRYWEEDVLNGTVNLNSKLTYFVEHGDFIGRTAQFLAVLLLLSFLVTWFRLSREQKH